MIETEPQTTTGFPVLLRVRRLVVVAVLSWIGYAMLVGGSKGAAYGEILEDGTQRWEQWTLTESPLVGIAIAIVAYLAISRAARHAVDEADAIRMIDQAGVIVMAIAGASAVIATTWFWMLPMPGDAQSVLFPFPFGAVEVTG